MKQSEPCPQCGKLAGWTQYLPGFAVTHDPKGNIRWQPGAKMSSERKVCASDGCGKVITGLVK